MMQTASAMHSHAPIIHVSQLTKSFAINAQESEQVLKGIDFQVSAGEFVSVVGPSGSGKSTFLYCISGLMAAESGVSELCGTDLVTASRDTRSKVRRQNASFIFQDYNLVDSMTAWENVQLGLRFAKKKLPKGVVDQLFERFGMAQRKNYYPAQLSGGQRQRVAIIRALAVEPRVLFADEPTGALDSATGRMVLDELASLVNAGTTVVMVTHDLEIAAKAQRAVVLSDGRLIHDIPRPTADVLFAAMGRG